MTPLEEYRSKMTLYKQEATILQERITKMEVQEEQRVRSTIIIMSHVHDSEGKRRAGGVRKNLQEWN